MRGDKRKDETQREDEREDEIQPCVSSLGCLIITTNQASFKFKSHIDPQTINPCPESGKGYDSFLNMSQTLHNG